MRPLSLAILALLCGAYAASAQSAVDARCLKMKDPVGCTCALAYGGTVANGMWARAPGSDAPTYNTCVTERGGKTSNRPNTIPGRL